MKGDRSCRDIKKNCTFHKDIEHNTELCVALRDEIEKLMRAGYFKEFMDEPHMTNREEQPHQQNPDKIREVLTIIGGSHVARKSFNTRDIYAKEAKTPPQIHVHRTEERPTKHALRELGDNVFTETDARWVQHCTSLL